MFFNYNENMDTKTSTTNTLGKQNTEEEPMTIRLYGTVPDSIVDGPGLRYSIFVQGCSHECPGCHNPESQSCDGGETTTIDAIFNEIRENGLVHDVTFSGGEPFEQAVACAILAQRLKDCGYGIWAYTGYLYEDLERIAQLACKNTGNTADVLVDRTINETTNETTNETNNSISEILSHDSQAVADFLDCIDVLVDGPFIEERRSLALQWRGSSNQRLIDIPATRAAGHIVEWSNDVLTFDKPVSW